MKKYLLVLSLITSVYSSNCNDVLNALYSGITVETFKKEKKDIISYIVYHEEVNSLSFSFYSSACNKIITNVHNFEIKKKSNDDYQITIFNNQEIIGIGNLKIKPIIGKTYNVCEFKIVWLETLNITKLLK